LQRVHHKLNHISTLHDILKEIVLLKFLLPLKFILKYISFYSYINYKGVIQNCVFFGLQLILKFINFIVLQRLTAILNKTILNRNISVLHHLLNLSRNRTPPKTVYLS